MVTGVLLLVGLSLLVWQKQTTFDSQPFPPGQPFPPEILIPDAPKTARDIEAFRSLRKTMSMADVVRKCGLPDDLTGSGIHIFVYRLRDRSTVIVGTGGDLKSLLYVQDIDRAGQATPLTTE
jgi:hypothetical protein